MRYRYELKYVIAPDTAAILKRRISTVLPPDPNADGAYRVHNLYLDDIHDTYYNQKYLGHMARDKYRIRYYNNDLSKINLERKHKDGEVSYKETAKLTPEQVQCLKTGDLDELLFSDDPLLRRLSILHRLRPMRPAAAFSYLREAYIYGPGDVRLTFDSGLKTDAPTPAVRPFLLLEVKYSSFMPSVITQLLRGLPLVRTETSKYCMVRERMLG